jgi:PIN domain nuclease of toxin-antitoxin system
VNCVADASAVLAVLRGERGADAARARLGGALLSAVNFSECVAKLIDRGLYLDEARLMIESLGADVAPFSPAQALSAAVLRSRYRKRDLSFADCACLALAAETGRPALTGDRLWAELDHGVPVEVFR